MRMRERNEAVRFTTNGVCSREWELPGPRESMRRIT